MPWVDIGPRGKGYTTFVDEEDLYTVYQYNWRYHVSASGSSVVTQARGKLLVLSRVIMNAPHDKVVDHIDHNTLNNSRSNLRICTRAENSRNMIASNVRDRGGRYPNSAKPWEARITFNYKQMHLGMFATEEEARQAVQQAKHELFGEFAPAGGTNGVED